MILDQEHEKLEETTRKFDSTNDYPTDLDIGRALTIARREHCTVQIDCKRCSFNVNENMSFQECLKQVSNIMWRY